MNLPQTTGIGHFASVNPEALALVAPDGTHWSRRELSELANRFANGFRAAGLREGDSLAIIAPNCAEFVALILAGMQAGLAIVPINWHLAEKEVLFILDDCEASFTVIHPDIGTRLVQAVLERAEPADRVVCIGELEGVASLARFVLSQRGEPVTAGAPGYIMPYTSATTGFPKAVQFPGAKPGWALEGAIAAHRAVGIFPEDGNVHLCASTLYHSAPLQAAYVALSLGHPVVLAGMWTPRLLLRLIHDYRVTTSFMVPSMFVRLLKLPQEVRDRYSTRSLRFVAHGAAPCPLEVKAAMLEWFGDVLWDSYGSTETFGGTMASPADWRRYPGTSGRPRPGVQVKICDDSGAELPPGQTGLVYVKPRDGFRVAYKGDPKKTAESLLGDYFRMGDIGYLNDEGYLFLCDRHSDLIISSGVNIYPAEIETALITHPAVADCAVVGQHHELLGQVPKAFVELESGQLPSPELTASLLRFLGARLSAIKLPKRVEYVQQLPRDPNGKLLKRRLSP